MIFKKGLDNMAFSFFNKNKSQGEESTSTFHKETLLTDFDIQRLAGDAGRIVAMFEEVKKNPEERLMLAAGMAGYACHQAVKENKEPLIFTETKDGKKFFFGDAVNFYLLENPYSVLNLLSGYYKNKTDKEVSSSDIKKFVSQGINNIADKDFLLAKRFHPSDIYQMVFDCWHGIYDNMTSRYCKTADEWSVLYAIVLQNILNHMDGKPEQLFNKAVECALYLSKMDYTSIRKKEVLEQHGEELIYDFYEGGTKIQLSAEDEQYIRNAVDMLREFCKENKIAFSIENNTDERYKLFEFGLNIRNEPTTVMIWVHLKPKMCTIAYILPFKADMNRLPQICTEICKMNSDRRLGAFHIDTSDGRLFNLTSFPCTDGLKKENFIMQFIGNMNTISNNIDTLKGFAEI